ncbi:DUF3099 domain-containing protein [Gordonia pseudamarae]|jgi:hypothetical protein|uniref:DUF3099 domain-containing protein n=1 Tax=Gordonia pseudamarae TaxID=2831662 RepID=A0ABX6IIK7_9ACTN|nr:MULTISPECIES: DUF3099 domain-containing protein [Gordonia]MBD0020896.1 DUF3099 domain-containing protein [Gordonia sp. (in: high G+C Gram-positive bacteria)]QHN26243.1 DUF3099 domain-containing protein [Gordonia pseudamarae]QHN35135.1 DUF3099 domain-containing protein [Gordonia pseudamarae]
MGNHGSADAFLITDAEESFDAQHRARVRKYLTLMAFRVPALIIAAIAYNITGSGLLALGIVVLSIPLPWVAVLVANDRPARKRGEEAHYRYGAEHHVIGPLQLDRTDRSIGGSAWEDTVVDGSRRGDS